MEPNGSLPCWQELAIGTYTEPFESSPRPYTLTLFLKDPFEYYSPIHAYVYKVASSLQFF
jgi:hypothetical protein